MESKISIIFISYQEMFLVFVVALPFKTSLDITIFFIYSRPLRLLKAWLLIYIRLNILWVACLQYTIFCF